MPQTLQSSLYACALQYRKGEKPDTAVAKNRKLKFANDGNSSEVNSTPSPSPLYGLS